MLVVHRCADGTTLAQALAEMLAEPPGDPFAREVVAVPAKGVERWLAQRLSHVLGATDRDGICANVEFPSPNALLDEAVAAASPEHAASVERWTPARAMWPLLDVIDGAVAESWCRSLARHLFGQDDVPGGDRGRRLALSRRLAGRYEEYGQARPEMLRVWAGGADETGDGAALAPDLHWEAELWRRLRALLGRHPAELLEEACSVLQAHSERSDLPGRLSVFGASRLSPARLAVLAALAAHRDVHLWVHHSSPALWETVRHSPAAVRRRDDAARVRLRHPLLSSLSRDLLEFQQLIGRHLPDAGDVLHEGPPLPDTLLGRLKADLAGDVLADPLPPHDPADRSVQVHACHGRTRQVEVLREVILGLLADDPSLEPRDVLVMCPDVESFAPIIAATFSLGAEEAATHPAARLRVRLADRALRQTNSLLAVLAQLLDLGTSRITASQVLDLAGAPAVRQRFGFDDDALERLREWCVDAGVRWGLDQSHRRTWRLDSIRQGTWRAGLDRILSGVAIEGSHAGFGDVVPIDDVDSSDIELAGLLAELVDRLATAQLLMSGQHTATEWTKGLEAAVLGLAGTSIETGWQLLQFRDELADIAEAASNGQSLLGLADVRALFEPVLAGRPTRASFRTGSLTVCTLVPMRSVPHRVVCLLGLDDGVFPRQSIRDGDDVLAREPWIGERDPRSEDRQLLLDAICAAADHLVITYTGADERTGAPVPPAVPLGELLDALDRTAAPAGGGRLRDSVTTLHPLQPFDARNFITGELRPGEPFSFDPLGFAGAAAAAGDRVGSRPFLVGPLPDVAPRDVALSDLKALLGHPARGFLRQRLNVAQARGEDEPADALPVELDGLQSWQVGQRLLEERIAGLDASTSADLARKRGGLPPGPLGERVLANVGRRVESLLKVVGPEFAEEPEAYDVDLPLPDASRLTGTVRGVRGDVLLTVTYSRLAAGHRLRAWIDLVALAAARPDRRWRAVAVGRARRGSLRSTIEVPTARDALASMEELVELYRSGLRAPLPLPVRTTAQYAFLRQSGNGVPAARTGAAKLWTDGPPPERNDPEHVLVYGRDAPMSVLTAQLPEPSEAGPGWSPQETDRFGRLAHRLWYRLLAAETQAQL